MIAIRYTYCNWGEHAIERAKPIVCSYSVEFCVLVSLPAGHSHTIYIVCMYLDCGYWMHARWDRHAWCACSTYKLGASMSGIIEGAGGQWRQLMAR